MGTGIRWWSYHRVAVWGLWPYRLLWLLAGRLLPGLRGPDI